MSAHLRQLVVPAYILLCLIVAGSARAYWGNLLVQLIGLAIIAWALIESPVQKATKPARQLLWLAAAVILLGLLQLVPLPPSLWTGLPGRQPIVDGYAILGMPLPSLPLSLAPHATIDALLFLIPPLAVFLGIVRLKAFRPVFAASAIIAGTVLGVGLSALQVASPPGPATWYLYGSMNIGIGVGFFANVNQMAALLLVTIPFVAALVPAAKGSQVQRYSALVAIAASLGLLVLVGLGLNGSLAGYALAGPVALASAVVLIRRGSRWSVGLALSAAFLAIVAVATLGTSTIGRDRLGAEAQTSANSRVERIVPTLEIARDFLPFGSGIGSFRPVFAMHEDPDRVGRIYVVHAHSDYAEWVMETGVPGAVLMLAFLLWWVCAVVRVWRDPEAGSFAKAASIASAALLAHSLVDFPLRTSAIASCFAFCLAMLADRRSPQVADSKDLRPTRHIVLD